jgi:bacteriochlorophyllide a dehydrogenase
VDELFASDFAHRRAQRAIRLAVQHASGAVLLVMKAMAVLAIGGGVELTAVEAPDPREQDVVVEVEYSSISPGTESFVISTDGSSGPWRFKPGPRSLGYGPVGRVISAGTDAAFAIGDRVVYAGPRGHLTGGHSSPAVVEAPREGDLLSPDAFCVKVPDPVSSAHAAFAGISAISYFASELAEPAAGNKVAVIGQGIVGLFATQHFALRGLEVMAIDPHERRLSVAGKCGADIHQVPGKDIASSVRSSWPEGADIVVDTTGKERVVEASIGALRPGGKYVFLGFHKGSDFSLFSLQETRAYRAYFPWQLRGELVRASLKLMAMGALAVAPVISHRFEVANAGEAYALLSKRPPRHTGILIDWTKP